MIQRVGLHILFWTAILFWRANGDYLTKAPFEKFVYFNLMRLPTMIAATYTVIYFLLPKLIIPKKQYSRQAIIDIPMVNFLKSFDEKIVRKKRSYKQ